VPGFSRIGVQLGIVAVQLNLHEKSALALNNYIKTVEESSAQSIKTDFMDALQFLEVRVFLPFVLLIGIIIRREARGGHSLIRD